jgi:hypothetical protein
LTQIKTTLLIRVIPDLFSGKARIVVKLQVGYSREVERVRGPLNSGLRDISRPTAGLEDLTMPSVLEDKVFPWAFGATVLLIILCDIALIWLLF